MAGPEILDAQASGTAALDQIELASAVLVRNFELLRRRSGIYSDLDRAEYLLLATLGQAGPADIAALAAALGVDPSTAGRQVAVMLDKGLVTRRPSVDDRRRSVITPTPEGQRRLALTRQRRRDLTGRLLAGWPEEDLRRLAEMFGRYNQAVADHYLPGQQCIDRLTGA
jgi:DNA-binding MarR family transcriptional regulator